MKKLGFGLMRLPLTNKDDNASVDYERSKTMIDTFIGAGGTYFDTAYFYHGGQSEIAFRELVAKRYPRESFTVTDKLPMSYIKEESDVERIFNEQLERCGVDYFDYYLLHALNNSYYETVKKYNCFEFVAKKKAEGKIRHLGFSFHDTHEVLETILSENPVVEFVQLQINYLDWENPTVQSRICYEIATRYKKSIIVMEPVKGGALANVPAEAEQLLREKEPDMSVASWALRYAASLENVLTVLSGMSTEEQMKDNLSYMMDFKPLNEEEKRLVEEVARIIKKQGAISCTACRYCTGDCPREIAIPDYFLLYNDVKKKGEKQIPRSKKFYDYLAKNNGKASDCIECGICEDHCPQRLEIRKLLKEVSSAFEV